MLKFAPLDILGALLVFFLEVLQIFFFGGIANLLEDRQLVTALVFFFFFFGGIAYV